MIVEHALLHVRSGEGAAFEIAIRQACRVIERAPGFHAIEVRADAERPDRYLLLVTWDSIAAHRDGFRRSAAYDEWRDLLHLFYDPMPEIAYFGETL